MGCAPSQPSAAKYVPSNVLPPQGEKALKYATSTPSKTTSRESDAASDVDSPEGSPPCPPSGQTDVPKRTPGRTPAQRRRGSIASIADSPAATEQAADQLLERYTQDDVHIYAKTHLNLDPVADKELLWIAEEALNAQLPEGWAELEDDNGTPYFHCYLTGNVTWEHPLDRHYKVVAARAQLQTQSKEQVNTYTSMRNDSLSLTWYCQSLIADGG